MASPLVAHWTEFHYHRSYRCGMGNLQGRSWVRRSLNQRRLLLHVPWTGVGNRDLLREILGPRIRPEWWSERHCWTVARPHFRRLVEDLATRFGVVNVFLEFSGLERCDTRCRDAIRDECGCSCLGVNHGGLSYYRHWMLVGRTTLVSHGPLKTRMVVVRGEDVVA